MSASRRLILPVCLLSLALTLALTSAFGPLPEVAAQKPFSPEQAVRDAWALAHASGRYDYRTTLNQTIYPALMVANAGRKPQREQLGMAGTFSLASDTLDLTLWRDGSFDPNTGLQLRVVNGQAYRRLGNGTWEETGDPTAAFTPGGDPLGFLAALKNIQQGETKTYDFAPQSNESLDSNSVTPLPEAQRPSPGFGGGDPNPQSPSSTLHSSLLTLNYTRYTFDIDGPAFAAYHHERIEAQLRASGQLPPKMELGIQQFYQKMQGQGELWLDAAGLPRRLSVTLTLPPEGQNGRIEATLVTDLSNYDQTRLTQSTATVATNPLAWALYRLPASAAAWSQLAINLALALFLVGAGLLFLAYSRTRAFHVSLVSFIIGTLVVSPLLETHQAYAYTVEQQAKQAAQEQRQTEGQQIQDARAAVRENRWDPHQNPLLVNGYSLLEDDQTSEPGNSLQLSNPNNQYLITNNQNIRASTSITSTDTDNDGLSDADEAVWITCAYTGASSNCTGVSDPTDTDGDDLSDGIEVNSLGTLPTYADTDGDAISDTLEVEGFYYNGQQWYLDPNDTDTNNDGSLDTVECPAWAGVASSTAICPDTDDDGTPDLFDTDDDGDNVDDSDDLSPQAQGKQTYSDDNPLELSMANLQLDKPVIVELQFRPTEEEHLTYSGLVLDWPTGDTEGQITRRLDTTFASTTNTEIQSTSTNAANGDIKLTPILEITMPYSEGHYANLPVNSTYYGISRTLGLEVDDWLDETELDPYGITVNDVSTTTGELVAYVPLSTNTSETGDEVVAFSAQMIYSPTQGSGGLANWGAAHEFRVIWLVQMITDECIDETADEDTCAREDELTLIHVYPESWTMTGMYVKEEHGLDVGIMYEDPTQDEDLSVDDQLWMYSWTLSNTFVGGQDCDTVVDDVCVGDGERDVTIANLADKLDEWGGTENYTELSTYSYIHSGYLAQMAMTETKTILNSVFTAYSTTTYPTFMFAEEITSRAMGLDGGMTQTTNAVTVDFSGLTADLTTSLIWGTYEYVDGAWASMDTEDYLDYLDTQTLSDSFFIAEDDTLDSENISEGKRIWAQIYYVSLASGLSSLAEIDNTSIWETSDEEYVDELYIYPVTQVATSGLSRVAGAFSSAAWQALVAKVYGTLGANTLWEAYQKMFWSNVNNYQVKITIYYKQGRYVRWFERTFSGKAIFAVGAALAIAGATLYLVGHFTDNAVIKRIGITLLAVSTIVLQTAWTGSLVFQYIRILTAFVPRAQRLASFAALNRTMRITAVTTFIITLVAIWGMFGYMVLSGEIKAGTVAFNMYLAVSIVQSLLALVIFLITFFLPIVGTVIVGIVAIIDAFLTIFGVTGLNDRLTEWLAGVLYDVNFILTNLDDADRIGLDTVGFEFFDEDDGFTVQNGFYYTLNVTNTIEGPHATDLKKSTFTYDLSDTSEDLHAGLGLDQMNDEWTVLDTGANGKVQMTQTVTFTVDFADAGLGINQDFDELIYLNEGYAVPYKGCWLGIQSQDACTYYSFAESSHLNLGAEMVYDILPNSLTTFKGMNWDNNSTISFPEQTDNDNDGLLSTDEGGTDPSDAAMDTDGDGLTDEYEIVYGYDAEDADADDDGLTDKEELLLGSSLTDADADGDGLGDYTELITGWLIVYDTSTNATTRVWSDPNDADADGDSLNDMEEFVFGLHPEVDSDPSVIKDIIQFDNIGVEETNAARLWLQLEEAEGLTTFTDSSGAGQYSACASTTTCPTAGETGRYGGGVLFDGSNDQITTTTSITLAKGDFSIGAWVKTTRASEGILSKNDGDTTWETGEKSFYLNSSGQPNFVGFGNNYIRSTQAITDGTWHYVAVVWDYSGTGTSGTGKMYVDGVDVTSASTNYTANNNDGSAHVVRVGRPNHNASEAPNYFLGTLDEVIVYDRALTSTEVVDLYYGRHNANDLVVQPGQDLTYQATVTNTSVTQSAEGFLSADTQYADPVIAEPEGVFRFEQTDYVGTYLNSTNESSTVTCLGTGTCPRTSDGAINNGVKFDGVNDEMLMPYLDQRANQTIAFWLKVPTTGTVQYLLDTDDPGNNSGAIDIYLNATGYAILTKAGVTQTLTSSVAITRNTWVHLLYVLQATSSKLYINGTLNASVTTSNVWALLGTGTIGNNSAGTAPYSGYLDELIIYDAALTDSISTGHIFSPIDYVWHNNYDIAQVGRFPVFLVQFQQIVDPYYDGTYFVYTSGTGTAYCSSTATCPVITTTAYSDHALDLDGSNDAVFVYTSGYTTTRADSGNFAPRVEMAIRPEAYPSSGQRAYLFDTVADGSNNPAMDVYLNASGKIVISTTLGVHTSTATIPLNSWTYVKTTIDGYTQVGVTYLSSFIYLNGVEDSEVIYASGGSSVDNVNVQVGDGYLGNTQVGTSPFNGGIDSLYLTEVQTGFDMTNFGGVSELNNLSGAAADCPSFYGCPLVDTSGAVGSALKFDGLEDYLTLDNESDYDFNQLTVAAWIKVASGEFNKTWQGIVTKGDSAWRLHRYNNTDRVAFGTTGLSNVDLASTSDLDDGQWHHIAGVYDGSKKYLYVDGVLNNSATVTGTLGTNSYEVWIGNNAQYSTTRTFKGSIDEVVLIPAAVDAAGVKALMNTVYPAMAVPDDFITYSVAALTTATASGDATVETTAETSQHSFALEAEAALELQTEPSIPVVDANVASLVSYFPFEDVPGVTTFENVVNTSEGTCAGATCPTGGLRGMADRAAYFDGVDDRLYSSSAVYGYDITIAAWVNATQGTLVDTRPGASSTGVQLDFNRFAVVAQDNTTNDNEEYALAFELPQNEWVHVVATLDDSYTATVYINGVLYSSGQTSFNIINAIVDKERVYLGGNVNQADFLQGYLDDVRVYSKALSASEVKTLYNESTPKLRFEFDEEDDATTYADSSVTEATGTPLLQTCADLTINSWRLNAFSASVESLYVALDGAWVTYDTYTNVQSSGTLNVGTTLCDSQSLSVGVVLTSGVTTSLGTRTITATTAGTSVQTFSSGSTSVTLTWTVGSDTTSVPNPAPGTDGQIGNTALFNGAGYVAITNATTVAGLTNTLTIMGWINPDELAGYQWILSNGRTSSNNGYGFGLKNDNLFLGLFGSGERVATNYDLDTGLWQHVAVVFDNSYDAYFYVDGLLVQSIAGATAITRNTDDALYIGASTRSGVSPSSFYEYYSGQIDELAVYSRTLSSAEIYSIYLRELRWYRDQGSATVTVDTDDPVIEYLSDYAYRADDYIQLAVSAVDTTSQIVLLDFGLKAPSASSFTWEGAPACVDTATSTATWCPAFSPSEGEGEYQVQFRAVDSVGNETTSSVYTLYVDDTAPTASSTYSSTWSNASTTGSDDGLDWTLTLTGTVSDSTITNVRNRAMLVSGSGVYTDTVMVSLVDERGEAAGGGAQRATITGTMWSVTYALDGLRPSGAYSVVVTAEDNVANTGATTVGTLLLDERPPMVAMRAGAFATTTITNSMVFSGVVSEQPAWGSAVLHLPLEQVGGAASLYDYSTVGNHAACITCPNASGGTFGMGAALGTNKTLFVPFSTTLAFTQGTAAAWIYPIFPPNTLNYNHTILAMRDANNTRFNWQISDDYQTMLFGNGTQTQTLNLLVAEDTWTHVALVFDTNLWTVYVNGVAAGTVTQTMGSATNVPLYVGSAPGETQALVGIMDEVWVFDRMLSEAEVYALAQKDAAGLNNVQIGLQKFMFNGSVATTTWQTAALGGAGAATLGTTWTYTLPSGLEDFYQVLARSTDNFGNQAITSTLWRGAADMVAPRLTFTGTQTGGGYAAQTQYTLTVNDLFVDKTTLVHPCTANDLTYGYDSNSGYLNTITAACRKLGAPTGPVTATACDYAGRCTSLTITPTTAASVASVAILTPTARSTFTTTPTTIAGGAYAPSGIQTVTVKVDGSNLAVLPYSGTVTNTLWSTAWNPTISKTYTLTAVMNPVSGGPFTDVITVTYQSPEVCFAEITGDNVTDYSSVDAGALRLAVGAAAPTATVKLAGTCAGVTAQSGFTQTVLITQPLTLQGGYAATDWATPRPLTQPTTLDAQGAGRVISATGNLTVTDLTVQNGVASSGNGGGFYVVGTLYLSNTKVLSNSASTGQGGGVYAGGALTSLNSQFYTNTSSTNGGGAVGNSTVTLSGGMFQNNQCTGTCSGGAASTNALLMVTNTQFYTNTGNNNGGALHGNGNIVITSAYFQGNRTTNGDGGALAHFGGTTTGIVISGTQFYSNTARNNGGAIRASGPMSVTQSLLVANTAANGGGGGGAVYLAGGGAFTNTLFARNSTTGAGQAIHSSGGTTVIRHSTIASPTLVSAAAVYVPAGTVHVTNTLIASHTIGLRQNGGTVTENYNLFSNVTTPYSGVVTSGGNSLTGTAGFVAPSANNYHLGNGSAAVNTGTNVGVSYDYDGDARPQGGGFDIGYDEALWYTVTVTRTGTGSGSVSSVPAGLTCGVTCTASFSSGTLVTLTATPLISSTFTGWSGGCSGTGSCVIAMSNAQNVTATFALNSYTLTVATAGNGNGIVTPTVGSYAYPYGTVVTLTASANTGSNFTGWSVSGATACAGTGSCVITMSSAHSVTATFALNTYVITPSVGAGGSIAPAMPQTVTHGSALTFTITPDTGYAIANVWVDGIAQGAIANYPFTNITANHTISAAFVANTYLITPAAGSNGSIAPATPQTVSHGDSLTFTITPDTGYAVLDVWVDGESVGALTEYVFANVGANHTISAAFVLNTYLITPAAGANGSITPSTPQTVTYGASFVFTITPNVGYSIVDVWVDGVSQGAIANYTFFNVTANHTISAAFAVSTYNLIPAAGAGGSITPGTPQNVVHGSALTFTIAPDTGYHIVDVGVDGVSQGPVSLYAFTNITANHVISAAFALNIYTITPTAGVGGSISPATPQTVNYGDTLTFTITPNSGYTLAGVWVDGVAVGVTPEYTFTNIAANHTLSAAFALNTYLITPTAGTGGTLTPATPQTVAHGGALTFTIAPNAGYAIAGVWVDGVAQGVVSTYAFTNVTANHTISAAFTINSYTLTVATAGTGSGVVTPTVGVYTYTYGTVVTLTATANSGSAFTGWSGACSGTGNCVVTMTNAQSVTATFDSAMYKRYLPFIRK